MQKQSLRTAAFVLVGHLLGCGTETAKASPAQAHLPPRCETPYSVIGEVPNGAEAEEAALCQRTGGQWKPALLTCACGPGRLLSAQAGCRDIARMATFDASGLHLPGKLTFVLPQAHDPALHSTELLADLQGYTFNEKNQEGQTLVTLGPVTKQDLEDPAGDIWAGPQSLLTVPHGVLRHGAELTDIGTLEARCRALQGFYDYDDAGAWNDLCADAVNVLGQMRSDSVAVSKWHRKQVGLGRRAIRYDLAAFRGGTVHFLLTRFGKAETPVGRKLTALHPSGLEAHLSLSPMGGLIGGTFAYRQPEPAASPYISRSQVVYFSHDFAPLDEETAYRGDRVGLRTALQEKGAMGPDHYVRPIPTDVGLSIMAPARALIMETEVDLRIPGLASRFAVDHGVLGDFLRTGAVGPLFSSADSTATTLAALEASPTTDHGTNVAGVLLADLPLASASLFNVDTQPFLDPSDFKAELEQRIRRHRPRVVNISRSFYTTLGACEEVFDPVFAAHSEDVVFVIAAGNYGEQNSPDICPANLALKHPNVLSVAGLDRMGKIHRSSNWGADLVNAAAPYCRTTLAPLDAAGDQPSLVEACGTSIAAPFIGNLALKLFAADPSLDATQVAAALKQAYPAPLAKGR